MYPHNHRQPRRVYGTGEIAAVVGAAAGFAAIAAMPAMAAITHTAQVIAQIGA